MVIGETMAKVFAWYDNESGYSCRVVDCAAFAASKGLLWKRLATSVQCRGSTGWHGLCSALVGMACTPHCFLLGSGRRMLSAGGLKARPQSSQPWILQLGLVIKTER
jgi:hypothetical protein